MPAYNAAKTLRKTYEEGCWNRALWIKLSSWMTAVGTIPWRWPKPCPATSRRESPRPRTKQGLRRQPKDLVTNSRSNGKTKADIIIMIHPDYQYTPKLIPAMASIIANGHASLHPRQPDSGGLCASWSGMPGWKYVANRVLTAAENILLGAKLSEYHLAIRSRLEISRELLKKPSTFRRTPTILCSTPTRCSPQIFWHWIHHRGSELPHGKYFKEASPTSLLHQPPPVHPNTALAVSAPA